MAYKGVLFQWAALILILDQGWIMNGCNCHTFFSAEPADKAHAESSCLDHKSVLASISNSEEKDSLAAQLASRGGIYWVGLHKIEDELLWNNHLAAVNLSWVDVSSVNGSNDCFIFNLSKVLPYNCSEHAHYVCEGRKPHNTDVTSCPQGTHEDPYSAKCFWYTHMPLSKVGSEVVCSLKHGRLIEMRGRGFPMDVAMFLTHEPISPRPDPLILWTSLIFENDSLVFEDGTEFSQQDFELSLSGDGKCVALVIQKGRRYALHRKPCPEEAKGVCQLSIDLAEEGDSVNFGTTTSDSVSSASIKSCPAGSDWLANNKTGFCYWENSHHPARLSWEDARKYCQSYGGDLVSLHSKEEQNFVFTQHNGPHSYWIGLYYDAHENKYVWADGTKLNYTYWAEERPDHQDKRLRCGYLDNISGKWRLEYCGMLSWFICKVPMQTNPPSPVLPTPEPLIKCSENSNGYYFNGYCYEWSSEKFIWHRAQAFCENQLSNLVSVHNEAEVYFLIRLLSHVAVTSNNRVWTGLNSFGLGGAFKWADGSPLDFMNWNTGEPNNMQNQEKCISLSPQNAMWSDVNCNAQLNFICKRKNDTTHDSPASPKTTATPVTGFCKKGWHMFDDRCFRLIGEDKSQWKNWTEAYFTCLYLGGYLASVRNNIEQAFLYYLVQNVEQETWIGLHDAIYSGEFYWPDNSPLYYTNWASGEPSPKWTWEENCVVISYGLPENGRWKDIMCNKQLPYICQIPRDPSITRPGTVGVTSCPRVPSYVKQGSSCYKVFTDFSTWEEAENTCGKDQGHLVSLYDLEVNAYVNYLAIMSLSENETFWIGLQSTNKNSLKWLNGYPMSFSRWGKNDLQNINKQDKCFYTSFSGFWQSGSCFEQKRFICQVNQGEPPKPSVPRKGSCATNTSVQWTEVDSFCLLLDSSPDNWREANFRCSGKGANLVSFHSMDMLTHFFLTGIKDPVFIGLTKNSEGGFVWSDGSPVDFVNWDQGEPRNGDKRCVEMMVDTMKWRVVPCDSKKYFICAKNKEYVPSPAEINSEENDSEVRFPVGAALAVAVIIILLAVAAVIVLLRLRPWEKKSAHHTPQNGQIMSFENQTYGDEATVDIQHMQVLYERE